MVLTGCLMLAACSDSDGKGGAGASASVSLASATATSASSTATEVSTAVTALPGTYGVFVTSPTDGADVAEPMLVCAVVTAEPDPGDLEVEVRLEDPSPPSEAGPPIRQAVHAGVATIRVGVDLSATGRHDVRVRLFRDGAAIEGAEDIVQDVVISGDRAAGGAGSCG